MNYDVARFWMDVLVFIITAGVWLYVWRMRRMMATNNKMAEIEANINSHVADNGVQLAHMDERLNNAIGITELTPMHERLNSMDKKLANMAGKMHTLDLIHEMLLNEGKKS